MGDNFTEGIVAYQLLGLNAEGYKADLNTDAVAMYLLGRQNPSGEWPYAEADGRPPICLMYIGQTAISMRALQLYAPKAEKAPSQKAISLPHPGWRRRNPRIMTTGRGG